MEKNPIIYVEHILGCILKIKEYTEGFDEKSFLNSTLTQDAVIRNFEIIGEATKQINSNFRNDYPNIEWKKIAGLRDKLIHDYIGVDLWAVWAIVENSIDDLEQNIKQILLDKKANN